MIQVEFIDDSRAELRLLVKSPPCDAIPPNVEQAPDLLFSALRGRLRDLLPTLATPLPCAAGAPAAERPATAAAAVSSLNRLHNPLYNMFGQNAVVAAA